MKTPDDFVLIEVEENTTKLFITLALLASVVLVTLYFLKEPHWGFLVGALCICLFVAFISRGRDGLGIDQEGFVSLPMQAVLSLELLTKPMEKNAAWIKNRSGQQSGDSDTFCKFHLSLVSEVEPYPLEKLRKEIPLISSSLSVRGEEESSVRERLRFAFACYPLGNRVEPVRLIISHLKVRVAGQNVINAPARVWAATFRGLDNTNSTSHELSQVGILLVLKDKSQLQKLLDQVKRYNIGSSR